MLQNASLRGTAVHTIVDTWYMTTFGRRYQGSADGVVDVDDEEEDDNDEEDQGAVRAVPADADSDDVESDKVTSPLHAEDPTPLDITLEDPDKMDEPEEPPKLESKKKAQEEGCAGFVGVVETGWVLRAEGLSVQQRAWMQSKGLNLVLSRVMCRCLEAALRQERRRVLETWTAMELDDAETIHLLTMTDLLTMTELEDLRQMDEYTGRGVLESCLRRFLRRSLELVPGAMDEGQDVVERVRAILTETTLQKGLDQFIRTGRLDKNTVDLARTYSDFVHKCAAHQSARGLRRVWTFLRFGFTRQACPRDASDLLPLVLSLVKVLEDRYQLQENRRQSQRKRARTFF